MNVLILPSLLAADVGHLEAAARQAERAGGDALHLDIMDGVFVPNISMGPAVVAMAKRCVTMPLSVHLMLLHPDQYVRRFAEAGATSLLIHIEAACDVPATLRAIRDAGVRPGITLNPGTPVERLDPVFDLVDEVLCMTVEPGYGGQSFMHDVLPKIRAVRERARRTGRPDLDIIVDGGVDLTTAPACARHGANGLVAGTALYKAPDMAADIRTMRAQAAAALA
ncbi:MAG: ribulose-phosphate 3-epimerase [Lentisphaerae bacterium]|nr:ribulose-phosphate 3-epimerase [Lentisphaerota bacterium]